MAEKLNKIQIRAVVFSSINNILLTQGKKDPVIKSEIEELKNIDDTDFLSKLLIKEFISTNDEERAALISVLMLHCVPVEVLEKNLWSNLALKEVSDEKKYQLIEILKSMGKFVEYDKYLDYFDEPQKVIDIDTNKILNSAMLNPEAQIDFLDFMETLSKDDKFLLIQSMVEDYSSDDLANIISPIIFYEKDKEIVEFIIHELINSESPLVYYPLKRYSELPADEKFIKLVKKGLKELQLKGINEAKAKEHYENIFQNSMLYKCYSGLPDGKGNQGLIFSRIRSDNSIQIFCVVINDLKGIIDCFGFNSISQLELSLIIKKFSNDENPFVTTFETGLRWLEDAENQSFVKNYALPYEYVCWKEIIFDINKSNVPTNEMLAKALDILPKRKCRLEEIFKTSYLDKLFFTQNDNKNYSEFIIKIDEKIKEKEKIDLDELEKQIAENIPVIFDEETINIFKTRLNKIAFVLMANSNHSLASEIYELTKDGELLNKFFIEVLKKSIFVFYEEEFQKRYSTESQKDNVFMKNSQKPKSKLENTMIKDLLEQILSKWGQDV